MRLLAFATATGVVALAFLTPVGAADLDAGARVQVAADSDSGRAPGAATGSTDDYKAHARSDMGDWKQKVHDFAQGAKAKGDQASETASADLQKAWHKTERAAHHLQTASSEGWDKAKAAYEKAVGDLKAEWTRVNPGG